MARPTEEGEEGLRIECEIPALHLAIQLLLDTTLLEQRLIALEQADENRCTALQITEAAKKRSKAQYDRHVHPRSFSESDLVLVYEKAHDKLGRGKSQFLWQALML